MLQIETREKAVFLDRLSSIRPASGQRHADAMRKTPWYEVCIKYVMFIVVIALAWLAVSFAFVLSLALAAKRPMPQASTEACLLDEAA